MNLAAIAQGVAHLTRPPLGGNLEAPTRITVTAQSADRRLVLPVELVLLVDSSLSTTAADDLADEVSKTAAEILCREPWRQTYEERRQAPNGTELHLSRWPIEGEPPTGAADEDPPAVTIVGGSAVSLSSYYVGEHRRSLYRQGHWLPREGWPVRQHYDAVYTAGYLPPGQLGRWDVAATPDRHIQTWEDGQAYGAPGASHAYSAAAGSWVLPTTPNGLVYATGAAGTSDSAEPTWPTAIGGTVVDNDITWTAHPDYIVLTDLARQALLALSRKVHAVNRNDECPADCAGAEAMLRRAFGGAC